MKLKFMKYGVLANTDPRHEKYEYNHSAGGWDRLNSWEPVWWWPWNTIIILAVLPWAFFKVAAEIAEKKAGGPE